MIHNGIEYGLMQAYAEGFDILTNGVERGAAGGPSLRSRPRRTSPKYGGAAASSVPGCSTSRRCALAKDPKLAGYSKAWSRIPAKAAGPSMAAIEEAVPADVLSAALYTRFRSREHESFSDKMLSAMRNRFGGHVEPKADT